MPWQALMTQLDLHDPKTSKKGGRPPYPLAIMLRSDLLPWCSLNDPAMEGP